MTHHDLVSKLDPVACYLNCGMCCCHWQMTGHSLVSCLQAQYKDYVTAIILRKNSFTGTLYRDDPMILAWDIANEPSNPGDDSGDILQV